MANICTFVLQVQGTKRSVEEFLKIIDGRYNYNSMRLWDTHQRAIV